MRNSSLGQQLLARGGPYIFDVVLTEFASRVQPPSVSPFYESLVQAARDVFLTLPEAEFVPSQPLPTISTQTEAERLSVLAAQNAKRDERLKYLTKFSHMVNSAIEFGGIKVIKPIVGVVTLRFTENGKEYKYEYQGAKLDEFRQDFEEATARGMIR